MSLYLVTGGCGFIGSHLADALLATGHRVRIIDDLSSGHLINAPADAQVMLGDVTDAGVVKEAMEGVDGCFHLAAVASVQRSNEDWLATHRVNAGGSVCVLEMARILRKPVVLASSAAVYGDQKAVCSEKGSPLVPLTAYGVDKLGTELHARVASLVHNVPTICFRFFNVYGPRQDPTSPYSGVISIFLNRIYRGIELEIYGDGEQSRDFIYVKDVVRFLIAGMAEVRSDPRVFNVCSGRPASIRALAAMIGRSTNCAPDIRFTSKRAGDIQRSVGCPNAAAAELGIKAMVALEDGLEETIRSLTRSETAALGAGAATIAANFA